MHNLHKYEFPFEFEVPATYPAASPELKIPELENKTAKMYRGGAICLTVHFKPLWAKNRRAGLGAALAVALPLPVSTKSSALWRSSRCVLWPIACHVSQVMRDVHQLFITSMSCTCGCNSASGRDTVLMCAAPTLALRMPCAWA